MVLCDYGLTADLLVVYGVDGLLWVYFGFADCWFCCGVWVLCVFDLLALTVVVVSIWLFVFALWFNFLVITWLMVVFFDLLLLPYALYI